MTRHMTGKKGRRTFAGQRMEDAGVARGGAGMYNWGNPMDDYGDNDIATMDPDLQQQYMEQQRAEHAEQKAAERE